MSKNTNIFQEAVSAVLKLYLRAVRINRNWQYREHCGVTQALDGCNELLDWSEPIKEGEETSINQEQ